MSNKIWKALNELADICLENCKDIYHLKDENKRLEGRVEQLEFTLRHDFKVAFLDHNDKGDD